MTSQCTQYQSHQTLLILYKALLFGNFTIFNLRSSKITASLQVPSEDRKKTAGIPCYDYAINSDGSCSISGFHPILHRSGPWMPMIPATICQSNRHALSYESGTNFPNLPAIRFQNIGNDTAFDVGL